MTDLVAGHGQRRGHHPGQSARRTPTAGLRPRHRDPGVQRGRRLADACAGCTGSCTDSSRSRCAHHHRRQREHRRNPGVAHRLAAELPDVRVIHLEAEGPRRRAAGGMVGVTREVVAYMDVDLSTDLSALMPLVAPLISGHSRHRDRLATGASSRVVRGPKREFVSRSYNCMLRGVFGARFSDAQCGFKAVRADVRARCCRWSPTPAGSSTPNCW